VEHADPALLADRSSVVIDGSRHEIVRRAGTDQRPIFRLEGCASREDAEALRRSELRVPVTEAPALQEGEFWAHELVGCVVVDGGEEIGVVDRMVALPSCEAIEVGGELIPLVRDAIRSLDVAARRIDVDMRFVRGN